MINLFPITKIIAWISAVYACSVLAAALVLNLTGFSTFGIALKGAVPLNLMLFGIAAAGWRQLWKWVPKLNTWIYPDLNGKWNVEINWNWGTQSGTKSAIAYIKQDLTKFSIELKSDESESETLVVIPHRDSTSSRPGLYYVYRNVGIAKAAKKQNPHTGAAILKLDHESKDMLHGNYFTDRSTNGQFTLRREN